MTDLAKKRTAFHELSRIYDYLDKIIDILVDDRPVNLGNQLPIAEQFIRKVTDSTGEIITIYCGIMGRKDGATSKEVLEIEKKINDIFSEVKNVLTECQKIDCKGNFEFSSQNLPVETAEVIFNENKIDVFNQLLKREGQLQKYMYNEARRLGTEKGGKLLLAVDDTALQLLDATRSMVIAGIPVDLNRLHGKEARPEFFGMAAPAYHKQADAPDVVVPIETDKKGFAIGARNED